MTGEENLRLIRQIEANRALLLATYAQNPSLLAHAEPRIRELFEPLPTMRPEAALPCACHSGERRNPETLADKNTGFPRSRE